MAGMPPDIGAGRGRGLAPPPWMQGPIVPSVSGPPPAPQAPLSGNSISTGPMVHLPSKPSCFGCKYNASASACFRCFRCPRASSRICSSYADAVTPLQPQPGQVFLPSSSPQFRPPSMAPNMTMHPPNMPPNASALQPQATQYSHVLPPSQGLSFNQQQRPLSGGPIQVPQQSQPMSFPPLGAVRVTPPPSFTFAASTAYSHQNFGVTPAPTQASATQQQVQAPLSVTQPWHVASSQTASGPPQIGQTGQQNSLTVNSVLGQIGPGAPAFPPGSDWQEHVAPDGRRLSMNVQRVRIGVGEMPR